MTKKEIIEKVQLALESLDYIENIFDYDPHADDNRNGLYVAQQKAKEVREILQTVLD